MSPGGLPSTVLPAADPAAQARLAEALLAPPDQRRDAVAARGCRPSTLPRRLGGPRRRRPRHGRALCRVSRRLPPWPRRVAGERVARVGIRALGGADRTSGSCAACAGSRRWPRRSARSTKPSDAGSSSSSSTPAARRGDGTTRRHRRCRAVWWARAADSVATRRSSRSTDGRWPSTSARCSKRPAASRWSFVGGDGDPAGGDRRVGRSSPTRGRVKALSGRRRCPRLVPPASLPTVSSSPRATCPRLTADAVQGRGRRRRPLRWPSPSARIRRWPTGRCRRRLRSAALFAAGVAVPRRRARCARRQSGDGRTEAALRNVNRPTDLGDQVPRD